MPNLGHCEGGEGEGVLLGLGRREGAGLPQYLHIEEPTPGPVAQVLPTAEKPRYLRRILIRIETAQELSQEIPLGGHVVTRCSGLSRPGEEAEPIADLAGGKLLPELERRRPIGLQASGCPSSFLDGYTS
jgi:hypothetical protein